VCSVVRQARHPVRDARNDDRGYDPERHEVEQQAGHQPRTRAVVSVRSFTDEEHAVLDDAVQRTQVGERDEGTLVRDVSPIIEKGMQRYSPRRTSNRHETGSRRY
jgi:hypothetical protein